MPEFTLKASLKDAGRRLDLFIIDFSKRNKLGFSRTFIQKQLLQGNVKLGNVTLPKPHYKVKAGDEVRISTVARKGMLIAAENIPLDIVYEDKDLAIINKPCGLVVHPAPGNYTHTLVNALLYNFKNLSDINPQRPGIVHRLDKETSGLLVIAKNNFAHLKLAGAFAEHDIKRKYIALVRGRMEFDENIIEAPIGRHPYKRKNMSVGFGERIRYAKTHYRTLKRRDDFSVLELTPFTGRTHQLRVHLAFLGHPILGDTKYGKDNKFSRLALHAKYLGFMHPRTGKFVEFVCDAPREFKQFLKEATT